MRGNHFEHWYSAVPIVFTYKPWQRQELKGTTINQRDGDTSFSQRKKNFMKHYVQFRMDSVNPHFEFSSKQQSTRMPAWPEGVSTSS